VAAVGLVLLAALQLQTLPAEVAQMVCGLLLMELVLIMAAAVKAVLREVEQQTAKVVVEVLLIAEAVEHTKWLVHQG
jgi:hypothetical protein